MKIINKKPIIWPIIRLFFPYAKWGEVIVTWGDSIYCYRNFSPDLLAHEKVHIIQQKGSKFLGLIWWSRYIFSYSFRLGQEIPAHKEQWRVISLNLRDRNSLEKARRLLSKALSSKVYGSMISFDEAYNLFI